MSNKGSACETGESPLSPQPTLAVIDVVAVIVGIVVGVGIFKSPSMVAANVGNGNMAWLFAWARLTVIQTGSIALLSFVFGDYLSQLLPLGNYATSIYAALALTLLTLLNTLGIQLSRWTQKLLTAAKLLGLLGVFGVGLNPSG
jgi:amino acid transporter